MKILLFFILIFTSSALSTAQDFKVININTDLYPNIEIIIELAQNRDKNHIQIYSDKKRIDFKIDPVIEENPNYIFYTIDYSSFSDKEQSFIFDALVNSIETLNNSNTLINIGFGQTNTNDKCFLPLSFAYTPANKKFILYAKDFAKDFSKKVKPECLIEQTLGFLENLQTYNNSRQTIIFLTNSIESYAQANSIIEKTRSSSVIHLKIVSSISDTVNIKPNDLYSVPSNSRLEYWKNIILKASKNNDLTNRTAHRQYSIKFQLSRNKSTHIVEIQSLEETLKLKINKPENYYFVKKSLSVFIISILSISILILLRRVYLLKKHIRNLKETISLLFDKKMKILSKQTENPVLEVKLENSFKNYHIKKLNTSIGRGKECDIIIKDMTVSTLHATITNEGGEFYIQDNESTNGVFVNDIKIKKKNIKQGDIIRLGKAILTLHY
jgi:hypothetical protein